MTQANSQDQPKSQSESSKNPNTSGEAGSVQTKQIGKYRVEVIREKCIGAASCVAIAERVFQLDEEDIAVVVSQDGHDDETKLLAAQSCPTAAIRVVDTENNKQIWPVEQ